MRLLKETELNQIIENCLDKYLRENLQTHDDNRYNLIGKLNDLGIAYEYNNSRDTTLAIQATDEKTKRKVKQLLNYYGWRNIKETDSFICAERIYGDNRNDFYDEEAEKDNDYPYGVGIYYHLTLSSKVPKILKQGLTVREGNKLGYTRGERTYLMSYPSKDFAYSLFRGNTENLRAVILLVDIRKYLGKQINLYQDDFVDYDGAVYTYDYIPPECIQIYETFELS